MVGIVILNYNSYVDTINCIQSIAQNTQTAYRIYIVDACSTDSSFSALSDFVSGKDEIRLIKSNFNGGYSYGNNVGARIAIDECADVVLIVNPDILFKKAAIDLMYDELKSNNNLAVIGPRIYDLSGKDMQFASRLYNLKSFLVSKKPFVHLFSKWIRYYKYDPEKHFYFQGMISGCCFMIKSDCLTEASYLDTGVFLFYEEDILAYKLQQMRKLTGIVPGAEVIHNHSSAIKKEGEAFTRFHRFYSSQYVLKRYAHINSIQYILISLFHIVPFAINSVIKRSYRKYLKDFLKKTYSLANEVFTS